MRKKEQPTIHIRLITIKQKVNFFHGDKYESDIPYTLCQGRSSYIESSSSKLLKQYCRPVIKSTKHFVQDKGKSQDCTLEYQWNFILYLILFQNTPSEKYILLCLMKIRLYRTVPQLADDFDVSVSLISKIFDQKMLLIVSVLSPFLKTFTNRTIKKNLLIAFRQKYNKVNCITDCLEIEIQKPKKAIHQTRDLVRI